MRTSAPVSSRWVAKQCRSVCGDTCFLIPALRVTIFKIAPTATLESVPLERLSERPGNSSGPGGRVSLQCRAKHGTRENRGVRERGANARDAACVNDLSQVLGALRHSGARFHHGRRRCWQVFVREIQ